MSGHSKWSTIKRQKGINDAKRGQLFSKLARAITLASKQGGPNLDSNLTLRVVVEKARQANMPKENIERAISRGEASEGGLEEVLYEGYGPLGVPILVEAATDNKNRTAQEIKNIFSRGGGDLSGPGSVSFQFEKKGQVLVDKGEDAQAKMLSLIDLGVEDLEEVEDGIEVFTAPSGLFSTVKKLTTAGIKIVSSEIVFKPKGAPMVLPENKTERVVSFLESLDDHDDVQQVYANVKI